MKANDSALPDKSLLNRTLYKDISIYKDTSIKVPSNKDSCKEDSNDKPQYDYLSLRNILRDETDMPITIEQAEQIGIGLTDLYLALYFDEP